MLEDTLEKDLRSFDYSSFSEIRESLLQELLQKHTRDNAKRVPGLFRALKGKRMADYELDYVAAAGNPNMKLGFSPSEDLLQRIKKTD